MNRTFSITYDLLAGSENYNIVSYNGDNNYVRIVPSVYKIEYEVCNEDTDNESTDTFTITYVGNGGTTVSGKQVSYTLNVGEKHAIDYGIFTRDCYVLKGYAEDSVDAGNGFVN